VFGIRIGEAMRNWVRSNWSSGAWGKRQVILAGLMAGMLLPGTVSAVWLTCRAPLRYRAVLEGEDATGPYFTTLAVASPNPWLARRIALGAARRQGLHILRVAEVEATGLAPARGRTGVLRAPWDKTYYKDDDPRPRQ
jgi:hypothetical protein